MDARITGFHGTDQKHTDLSELPDTSSLREGTTRSVLTKSVWARVDEITSLVLKAFGKRDITRVGPHDKSGLTSVSHILMVFAERYQRVSLFAKTRDPPPSPCPTNPLLEGSRLQNQAPCHRTPRTSLVRNDPCRAGLFSPSSVWRQQRVCDSREIVLSN